MSQSSYEKTITYLYRQLPMYQRQGVTAYKKDLTNIRVLLDQLDQPQQRFPSIHIAGTNGKGSVAHLLAAILQAHGLRVGLYTSPHYRDFRERIKINGTCISEAAVIDFIDRYQSWELSVQPSFFELTVAMAFEYFAQQEVDIAIIETGLGGRLDSTNILEPVLSIITNISLDHQSVLGDTLPEIAAEKAGIIKLGTPVVIGQYHPDTWPVFEQTAAQYTDTPVYLAENNWALQSIATSRQHITYDALRLPSREVVYPALAVAVGGYYQAANLVTVLQAVELLHPDHPQELRWKLPTFSEKKLRLGLARLRQLTKFIGRWQVIGLRPTIITDAAHNEAGLQMAMQQLQQLKFKRLHIVLGMVSDKDINPLLALLPKDATYYFSRPGIPRGMDASMLKAKALLMDLHGRTYKSVPNALKAARKYAKGNDLIYVGGSSYVVAEVV